MLPVPDKAAFRRRYILRLASSPLSLLPFLLGITTTFVGAAGDMGPATLFSGLAIALGGAGVFFSRLLAGSESAAQKTVAELESEVQKERQLQLLELRQRLSVDQDARDDVLFDDLHTLSEAFAQHEAWALDAASTFDLLQGFEALYQKCIESLERNLSLLDVAQKMQSDGARAPILKEREALLAHVTDSVAHLGQLLAKLQSMDTAGASVETELRDLRSELDESLAIAERTKARMRAFEKDALLE